jgi:hypothetical protein
MKLRPIGKKVNNWRNNGADLADPIPTLFLRPRGMRKSRPAAAQGSISRQSLAESAVSPPSLASGSRNLSPSRVTKNWRASPQTGRDLWTEERIGQKT